MIRKLGLITTENLPVSPAPCAGGGLRIWSLGEALIKRGIECVYLLLEERRNEIDPRAGVNALYYRPDTLNQVVRESGCDAVLVEQWQPLTFLQTPIEAPVIVDLPGPLILEYYWRTPEHYLQHITDKLLCLSQADYFICAHERQRGYYSAWLNWAGVPPDELRLAVTPFLLHEMPRGRQGYAADEPILFWGGMFWPWHKRFHAFQNIVETLERLRRGQLSVIGAQEDDPDLPEAYRVYADHPNISWQGRFAFMEYIQELKQAHVAIDLSAPTQERWLSSDLRTGTALWAGTPCIAAPESPWAEMIEQHQAGWVIPFGDSKALIRLIEEIVLERGDMAVRRRGAKEISQWISNPERINGLVDFLRSPTKRKSPGPIWDRRTSERERMIREAYREIDTLKHENSQLRIDLESIRSNILYRLYKKITGFF